MHINSEYIMNLSRKLRVEVGAGNQCGVYDQNMHHSESEEMQFFKNNTDARTYCEDNIDGHSQFKIVSIDGLLASIERVLSIDKSRSDIDYYVIDDLTFDVSRILKTNPDQNPLLNPDGNDFTDAVIDHWEDRRSNRVGDGPDPIRKNFAQLKSQLEDQGFDSDFFLTLETSMRKAAERHSERYYDHLESKLVMYDHLFLKDSRGIYSLDKITGTLYFYMEVDHATIKGTDTQELDFEMMSVNWEIDGFRFLKKNEQLFRALCEDEIGRKIAVQMFNNNVPPYHLDKPEFLLKAENELRLYPKMEFPGEATAGEINLSLERFQAINDAIQLYSIPEFRDTSYKAMVNERLANGDTCSVIVPAGSKQGEEVLLSWNDESKTISFIFKDETGVNAEQHFDLSNTEQFQKIANELKQYSLRQAESDTSLKLLVLSLLKGDRRPVQLERDIVPGEIINKFVVLEIPRSNVENKPIVPIELFNYKDLKTAKQEMDNISEHLNLDEDKVNSSLVLIGQYKEKALSYDLNGMPTTNTGYKIASNYNFSSEGCIFSHVRNLDLNVRLNEQLLVQLNKDSHDLVFSNKHGQEINIDKDFWSSKNKVTSDNSKAVVDEELLSKKRISSDKGLSI